MPIIEVKGVSYNYPIKDGVSLRAIRNLSFCVDKGEFVTLAGMNGSGKSTLAKLLNGLFKPTQGEILIDGMSTADEKFTFEIRKKVGMVFQNPDNQTVATIVEDDVAFGPENLGLPREEISKRVDFALSAAGISEFRERAASKLSGGQKQRVAIAGALAMLPDVLILDEATSMLDPAGRREIMAVAKELNKSGMTIINITHNMDEAALSDRVIVLKAGRLAIDGTPAQTFSSPLFEDCGLKLPPIEKLKRELLENGVSLSGRTEEELAEELWRLLK